MAAVRPSTWAPTHPPDPTPLLSPQDEIADALERIIAGPEKKGAVMSEKKKRLVAYHEAGHALVREGRCRMISVVSSPRVWFSALGASGPEGGGGTSFVCCVHACWAAPALSAPTQLTCLLACLLPHSFSHAGGRPHARVRPSPVDMLACSLIPDPTFFRPSPTLVGALMPEYDPALLTCLLAP